MYYYYVIGSLILAILILIICKVLYDFYWFRLQIVAIHVAMVNNDVEPFSGDSILDNVSSLYEHKFIFS